MSVPAGYRTFFCETNTKAIIIIVIYIYDREIQNSETNWIMFVWLFCPDSIL